jgi:hypothetical protein
MTFLRLKYKRFGHCFLELHLLCDRYFLRCNTLTAEGLLAALVQLSSFKLWQ